MTFSFHKNVPPQNQQGKLKWQILWSAFEVWIMSDTSCNKGQEFFVSKLLTPATNLQQLTTSRISWNSQNQF